MPAKRQMRYLPGAANGAAFSKSVNAQTGFAVSSAAVRGGLAG